MEHSDAFVALSKSIQSGTYDQDSSRFWHDLTGNLEFLTMQEYKELFEQWWARFSKAHWGQIL